MSLDMNFIRVRICMRAQASTEGADRAFLLLGIAAVILASCAGAALVLWAL